MSDSKTEEVDFKDEQFVSSFVKSVEDEVKKESQDSSVRTVFKSIENEVMLSPFMSDVEHEIKEPSSRHTPVDIINSLLAHFQISDKAVINKTTLLPPNLLNILSDVGAKTWHIIPTLNDTNCLIHVILLSISSVYNQLVYSARKQAGEFIRRVLYEIARDDIVSYDISLKTDEFEFQREQDPLEINTAVRIAHWCGYHALIINSHPSKIPMEWFRQPTLEHAPTIVLFGDGMNWTAVQTSSFVNPYANPVLYFSDNITEFNALHYEGWIDSLYGGRTKGIRHKKSRKLRKSRKY